MSYYGSKERNRRLKKCYNATKHQCIRGVYFDEEKCRYIRRYSMSKNGATKYFRKISNQKVRRNKENLSYGAYRKVFDYWWTLW